MRWKLLALPGLATDAPGFVWTNASDVGEFEYLDAGNTSFRRMTDSVGVRPPQLPSITCKEYQLRVCAIVGSALSRHPFEARGAPRTLRQKLLEKPLSLSLWLLPYHI